MTVNQISVFLENKAGQLAELTNVLSANGISMRALSIADTRDYGIARIMVDDPFGTLIILKDNGWIAKVTPVLAVSMEDKAGALDTILNVLAKAGIALEYVYAFLTYKQGSACLVLRTADAEATAKVLTANGIKLLAQDELYKV
jgi:hypothetical protein